MKVQRLQLKDLELGMQFSAPVFFDDGSNMFLAERKEIKKFHLDALRRWNIPFVITYGHILTDDELNDSKVEELEELDELEEIDELEELEPMDKIKGSGSVNQIINNLGGTDFSKIHKTYQNSIKELRVIFSNIKKEERVSRAEIDTIASNIYDCCIPEYTEITTYVMSGAENDDEAKSAINIAILSCILAIRHGLTKRYVIQVIIAAMLHDIGMFTVPEQVVTKKTSLTASEYDLLKLHPLRSARFASEVLFFPKDIETTILQHHERWDGEGYPDHLQEENIDLGARIIAITDAFISMISVKKYRESILGYDAMKKLMEDNKQHFDPELLQSFIDFVGIYPIGSLVLLSNNAVAQVVEGNADMPYMPNVRILIEPEKSTEGCKIGDILQLAKQKKTCIIRALKNDEYKITA